MAPPTINPPPDETVDELSPTDPIWGDMWNPHQNRWAPTDEPVGGDAGPEPHGDNPTASPTSEAFDYIDPGGGTGPDARTNVQQVATPGPGTPPTQRVVHEMETYEVGGEIARGRVIVVGSNLTPAVLLDENPNRKRALIKVITSTSVILVGPHAQLGSPGLTAPPTAPLAAYPIATGDPVHEIKSQAAIDVLGVGPVSGTSAGVLTTPIMVAVWEETNSVQGGPGLTGG